MTTAEQTSLSLFAKRAYLAYAMSVVRGRAIPDVEDGLKPVQRRILFAMHKLGLAPNTKPSKSARVVGEVIGKYHPHGYTAVYDALVRMSQSFSLRYPLIHGEGNFGTRDGDSAAAMRYTETKLTPISAALLDELAWDTVDFVDNFDNSLKEPETLPSRLPFLLLNGASGIGVGLATEFLSHQLNEVVEGAKLILTKKSVTLDELMEKIPGPDFPTGGQIISTPEEIKKVYMEGRGSLRLRARWTVKEQAKGRWRLHFFEIPQTTSAKNVLEQLGELLNPKPKEKNGKRLPLSPEQLRLKKLFSELVDEIHDVSSTDDDGKTTWGIEIVPKDRKMAPDDLARTLCAHTDLESNAPVNFVAVDATVSPRQGTLVDWLTQWCEYRVETVRRRLTHEKATIDHRLHIIAGRLSILDHIEEVVQILKTAKDARQELMDRFKLDEEQANDVLDMRLRQLANLERFKLEDEQAAKLKEQARLARLLADDKLLRKLVIQELEQDAKTFGDTRRTLLQPEVATSAKAVLKTAVSEKMAPEPVAIALTERGWISWRPAKTWEEARSADFKIRAGDQVRRIFFGDRNDHLLLLDESGKGYSLHLMDLASRADTQPLSNWFDAASRISEGAVSGPEGRFILAGQKGYGFIVKASDWVSRMKAGKALLTLESGESPLPPHPLPAEVSAEAKVLAWSTDGRAVAFPFADLKALPKGKGVALLGLADDAALADLVLIPEDGKVVLKTPQGSATVGPNAWEALVGARSAGKKGKILHTVRGKPVLGTAFERPGREEAIVAPPSTEA